MKSKKILFCNMGQIFLKNMTDIKRNYSQNGYVVIKNVISSEDIDNMLACLDNFKKNKKIFYSQSERDWKLTTDALDENNLLKMSILDFTDLPWARDLSNAGRNILQSKVVNKILSELTGEEEICMWQNMLFDKSTGTVDHIDTYYLDTNPMGKLIAGWFALEKIDGNGGAFHVYPGSHLEESIVWKGLNQNAFLKWTLKKTKQYKIKKILLNKGDCLFWHPSLIHGSSLTQKEGKSRKSLTAHYYPTCFVRGGGGKNDLKIDHKYKLKVKNQKKTMRSFGYPVLANKSRRQIFITATKGLVRFLVNKNKPKFLMNRENYNFD